MHIAIALTRGVHFAAVLSMFGTLVVAMIVAPAAARVASVEATQRLQGQLAAILRGSVVAGLLVGLLFLLAQAADMAGTTNILAAAGAVPIVFSGTQFGKALALRLILMLVIWKLADPPAHRARVGIALVLGVICVAAESWMGHPAAADDNVLLGASIAHVLAAGAWLGSLVPLYLVVRAAPGVGAANAAARFSWIGQAAVVVLAVTAWLQSVPLIGNEAGLLGTKYGLIATFKLVLFGVLFLIAVINRFKLSPKLQGADAENANRHLTTSIAIETVLGLLVVLAAGWLATSTPGAHEEPDWYFALRPNWPILDDPLVKRAFIEAGVMLVVALALVGRAALFRRWRLFAIAGAAALVWYSNKVINDAPFLDPIFVEAYPTSYYFSQSGFTADTIAQGAHVFAQNCVMCHGPGAEGNGPAAKSLPVPPANLTQAHVWMHSDGEMYWWLKNGIAVPPYGTVMPAWGSVLSSDDRWALIDFIHANLAGASMASKGLWDTPVAAPSLAVVCGDGKEFDLGDMKGKFVRIVAMGAGDTPPTAVGDVPVVLLMKKRVEMPGCVAEGDTAWQAYAIMAHAPADQLGGTQFLIDPDGWIRWVLPSNDAAKWATTAGLDGAVKDALAHPLVNSGNPMAGMKM